MGHDAMTTETQTMQHAEFVRRYGPSDVIDRFLFEDRLNELLDNAKAAEIASLKDVARDAEIDRDNMEAALDHVTDSDKELRAALQHAVTAGLVTAEWLDEQGIAREWLDAAS